MTAPVPIGASPGMPFLPPASATPSVNPAVAANTAPLVAAQIQSQIGGESGDIGTEYCRRIADVFTYSAHTSCASCLIACGV